MILSKILLQGEHGLWPICVNVSLLLGLVPSWQLQHL